MCGVLQDPLPISILELEGSKVHASATGANNIEIKSRGYLHTYQCESRTAAELWTKALDMAIKVSRRNPLSSQLFVEPDM